jgi:hypothetical protein
LACFVLCELDAGQPRDLVAGSARQPTAVGAPPRFDE